MTELFKTSLAGTLFILAAILIRAGLRDRLTKHFLLLLWAAVLFRLLIPTSLPSPTSIYNFISFHTPTTTHPPLPSPITTTTAVAPTTDTVIHTTPKTPRIPILPALWLAGALTVAALFALNYRRAAQRFNCAIILRDNPVVNHWRTSRPGAPHVYVSDQTAVPLAFGILRPRIILPAGMDFTQTSAVEGILEHEYVHGRHFHNAMKVLASAAVIIHWFNPLVWLFWFLFNHDLELACDEKVIRTIGPARRAEYARSLVAAAEKAVFPIPLVSAFSARNLRERIVDIMGYRRATASLLVAEAALVVGLFALFGTSAASTTPITPTTTPPPENPPTLAAAPAILQNDDAASAAKAIESALTLTGGGAAVELEVEGHKGRAIYEVEIVSNRMLYEVKVDGRNFAPMELERKGPAGEFSGVDTSGLISMEQAIRTAMDGFDGAELEGCSLERIGGNRLVYMVEFVAGGREYETPVDAARK